MLLSSDTHFFRAPTLTRGVSFLVKRHLYEFQRSWPAFLLWSCIEPMIYLCAFGFGLGQFVQQVQGESYLTYFLPGLLCLAVAHSAYLETSINSFSRFNQVHLYRYLLLAPVTPDDLAAGDILWNAMRALISAIPVCMFGWFYGILHPQMIAPTLLFLLILSVVFAAAGLAVAAGARQGRVFTRGFSMAIIPMTFLSGAFFPIEILPQPLYWVLWPLPLHQAVLLTRMCLSGQFEFGAGIHLLILLFFGAIALLAAMNLTVRRLMRE